jgi:hypothetical protein
MPTGARNENKRNSDLARRRAERRASRGNVDPADWGSVDAQRVVALISAVARAGGLCSFGYTRDGGTYTITTIMDGERNTDYCRPNEDISAFIDDLADDFNDVG